MIAQRILAILSAIFLVGSVAVATLGPPGLPLGQALFLINHDLMDALHGFVSRYLSDWTWLEMAVPLLVRPAWLIPASAGLICAGAALSLSSRPPARRSSRRSQ